MTIDEAIKNLKTAKESGTKNIILAWWGAEMFDREDDKLWQYDSERVEQKMDWSMTHETLSDMLRMCATENDTTTN